MAVPELMVGLVLNVLAPVIVSVPEICTKSAGLILAALAAAAVALEAALVADVAAAEALEALLVAEVAASPAFVVAIPAWVVAMPA